MPKRNQAFEHEDVKRWPDRAGNADSGAGHARRTFRGVILSRCH